MIRNIANVVHDLTPIIEYLKKKALDLPQVKSSKELMDLIGKIQKDAIMLEHYLHALAEDAKKAGIEKNIT